MADTALTTDEIRSLLRECVTVVKPGETLVIRMGAPHYTPQHMREVQDIANHMAAEAGWPPVMAVPGDELGVVEPAGFLADCRIESGFDDAGEHHGVKITHLPTGASVTKPTYEEAVVHLGRELVSTGDITINDARAALGLLDWVPKATS